MNRREMKTILVVDDEPQIAGIARDYLRLAGFDGLDVTRAHAPCY